MRYIPSSRYTLDEIAEQCRNAVLRASQSTPAPVHVEYGQVLQFYRREHTLLAA